MPSSQQAQVGETTRDAAVCMGGTSPLRMPDMMAMGDLGPLASQKGSVLLSICGTHHVSSSSMPGWHPQYKAE